MEHITIIEKAARAAGKIINENFGQVEFSSKEDYSHVSFVDKECERIIKQMLLEEFPDYGFIGEEFGEENKDSEYKWVVDPLDGTTNYKCHVPFFNTSIALTKNGQPIAGAVYSSFLDEMFSAIIGKGATLNGEKIHVSSTSEFKKTILGVCHSGNEKDAEVYLETYPKLKRKTSHARQFGASALELAYVAAGRIDGFMMIAINAWDVAAGKLIVEEAGGKVTNKNGEAFTLDSYELVATNGIVHEELLSYL